MNTLDARESSRILFHIGPPKTATTSFQFWLQAPERKHLYHYHGVFQPRNENPADIAQNLHDELVKGAISSDGSDISPKILKQLRHTLETPGIHIFSEERFLVTDIVPFETKIKALARIFQGKDISILLTVRPPASGLVSLYQEIYDYLPLHLKVDFQKFCLSEYARCFDYRYVLDLLKSSGLNNITIIPFDRLVSGKTRLNEFAGPGISDIEIRLDSHNTGSKSTSGNSERILPEVTLRKLLRSRLTSRLVHHWRLKEKAWFNRAVSFLDKVSLRKKTAKKLEVPHTIKARLDKTYSEILQETADNPERSHSTHP